jgi:hypothetical protein
MTHHASALCFGCTIFVRVGEWFAKACSCVVCMTISTQQQNTGDHSVSLRMQLGGEQVCQLLGCGSVGKTHDRHARTQAYKVIHSVRTRNNACRAVFCQVRSACSNKLPTTARSTRWTLCNSTLETIGWYLWCAVLVQPRKQASSRSSTAAAAAVAG